MAQDQDKNWWNTEFSGADFGDLRLTKRLIHVTQKLADNPMASIPQACGSWVETKAAYRFFDNDKVTADKIHEPHYRATKARTQSYPVILAVQDTTQLNFTHHPATEGLGCLNTLDQQGFFYHPTLLVSPEKVPLGIIDHQVWQRQPENFGKKHQRRQKLVEEKESQKWLHSLRQTARCQEEVPEVRLVNVADREADIYDYFQLAQELDIDVLVRAAWNRRIEQSERYLWEHMAQVPVCQTITITVPRKSGKPAREAVLSIRFSQVDLRPPRYRSSDRSLQPIPIWVVYAHEEEPPAGSAAISWMLLTTVAVHTSQEAIDRVNWYTCRWQIELLFKILKSGCKIEQLQLETFERLCRALALYAIVAWRVLFLTMQSRSMRDIPCDILLEEEEWQALYCYIHKTPTPPSEPPTLLAATRMIARLGGFLGRKSDGHPGATTVWRGLQRLADIVAAWSLGRRLAKSGR
ncbi:MAG: IS4 family transposase [Dissulfurimicrobium sp.]